MDGIRQCLENYTGVNSLKRELSGLGFRLIDEIKLPVDEFHDTVGMLWKFCNKQNYLHQQYLR